MRSLAEHRDAVHALLDDAWARLAASPEEVPLRCASGRVLAVDLSAPLDLPPFDNSQMDGYAVGAPLRRLAGQRDSFTVMAAIPAGRRDVPPLRPGEAAPIMTGAPVPAGAIAVIPVEAALPSAFLEPTEVVTTPLVSPGSFIRRRGSDIRQGQSAIAQGTRLSAAHLGLLAGFGLTQVRVRRRPRIGVMSTGDELVSPPHETEGAVVSGLPPGAIYDVNTPMLSAALAEAGAEAVPLAPVPDDPARLREVLATAPDLDALMTTGGVSRGVLEVVRQALPGVEFCSVAMQPGGPQGLGSCEVAGRSTPVVAFPGNSVSALVSFEVFLRPLLIGPRPRLWLPLLEAVHSPEAKHQIRRARLRPEGVEMVGGPGSHLLHALAEADALAHLPVGLADAPPGTEVEVWPL